MKLGVSFYSYQNACQAGTMGLEDCMKAMKALPGNVDGIELLALRGGDIPQVPSYIGRATPEEMARFKELAAKYQLKPVCYDSTMCRRSGPDFSHGLQILQNPSREEYEDQMKSFRSEIDFCAEFGFPILRAPTFYGVFEEVMRDCLPYAHEKNVKVCIELHPPLTVHDPLLARFMEMLDKTCPEAGGLIPDFGIYSRHIPRNVLRMAYRRGLSMEVLDEADKVHDLGGDVMAVLASHGIAADDPRIADIAGSLKYSSSDDPAFLKEYAPWICHCHAKFYEMDENCEEYGIDFAGPIRVLQEIGFEGYLSAEYEGQRYAALTDEVEQVRRMVVMCRRLLDMQD